MSSSAATLVAVALGLPVRASPAEEEAGLASFSDGVVPLDAATERAFYKDINSFSNFHTFNMHGTVTMTSN